jgi:RNA polymerase sigma factor (sigma-70 family)
MRRSFLDSVLRGAEALAARDPVGTLPDPELLRRFAAGRDAAAFAMLVRRHGPLVWGVCRNLLPADADAEDAFQATFLVFVRKAARLRRSELVAGWLHGVARRTAARARVEAAKRRSREAAVRPAASSPDPLDGVSARELLVLVDAEIARLPERYRGPIVACHLEGRTRDEAAHDFGWSLATVARRLEQGRKLLGARLARRGVALAAVSPLVSLVGSEVAGQVPGQLAESTIKIASVVAHGGQAASVVPASAAALAEGVMKAMFRQRIKTTGLVLLLAGLVGAALGSGLLADRTQAAPAPKAEKPAHPLAGTWAYVRIESRSPMRKENPMTFEGEKDTQTYVFEKGACKMIQQTRGDDGKVNKGSEYEVTVDDSTDPPRLTLHVRKDGDYWKIRFIYEVKGDTLRLGSYSLAAEDGKELVIWPKGFDLDQEDIKKYPRVDTFKRVDARPAVPAEKSR